MNHLTKILFLFSFIAVVGNIAAKPALSQTASPTFSTHYEYYEKVPTDPASLAVIITPQDLGGREIYGVQAYYQTDQYQLPTPFLSNFNINFQGWGSGDWTCDIGQKSLSCHGGTALETGKKTIIAMYFSDNITPPDSIVTNILDSKGELIKVLEIGSTPSSTNQEPSKEPLKESPKDEVAVPPTTGSVTETKEDQQVQSGKQFEFTSWVSLGAIVATSAIALFAIYLIRLKKLLQRKKIKINKPCPTCNGTGKIKITQESEIVKCPNCQNVSAKRCPHCGGTGKMNEAGQLAPPTTREALDFLPPCDWCRGTGWKDGAVKKMVPYFTGAACTICKGRGYTVQKREPPIVREETCPTCKGKGVIPA